MQVLEGENAVLSHRENNGALPTLKKRPPELFRADFAASIDENAVHGSDAVETAKRESLSFSQTMKICARTRLSQKEFNLLDYDRKVLRPLLFVDLGENLFEQNTVA